VLWLLGNVLLHCLIHEQGVDLIRELRSEDLRSISTRAVSEKAGAQWLVCYGIWPSLGLNRSYMSISTASRSSNSVVCLSAVCLL
jgi:hypothetical protein